MDPTLFIQLLISGILLGGIYALASIGLTLIFGVMKIVNFAHGEFFMIAMYLTYWLVHYFHIDPYLSTLILVPVVFLIGIVTYYLFIRPTLSSRYSPRFSLPSASPPSSRTWCSSSGRPISGASPSVTRPNPWSSGLSPPSTSRRSWSTPRASSPLSSRSCSRSSFICS